MNRVGELQVGYKKTSLSSIKGKITCKIHLVSKRMRIREIPITFQYQHYDHHNALFLTRYVCRITLKTVTQSPGF